MTAEDIKSLKDKGVKFLKDLFTPEEITALNAQLAPAADPAPVPTPVALSAKEMKTKEGVSVFIVTDEAGVMKAFTDAEGTLPQADGELVMEDGSTLVISGGIATVKPVEAPEPMADMKAQLSAQEKSFSVKLADQKKAFDAEIARLNEVNKVNASIIQKMLDQPIYTVEAKKAKTYEEMTPAERYNHDNPIK
jgi:hypothetical protein